MKDYRKIFFIGVLILSSCSIFNASAQDIVGDLSEGISQATNDQGYDQYYDKAYEFYQNKDWDNAIRHFNAAYKKDNSKTDAIYMIGVCFYQKKNYDKAVQWFRNASNKGDGNATYFLGICYEKGLGVNMDKDEALSLYQKAAKSNAAASQKAANKAKELRAQITPTPRDQRERAECQG